MPTGYTADVRDGKIDKFEDFAMLCARAFGAMILLRDEDQSLEATRKLIEEKAYLSGDGYLHGALEAARQRLAILEAMSDETALAEAQHRADEVIQSNAKREEERLEYKRAYEAMLAQVEAWEPPSADHESFKEFMIQQLADSIKFDCSPYSTSVPEVSLDAHRKEIEKARSSIVHHEELIEEEQERNEGRARWVEGLIDSLDAVAAS